MEYKALPMLTKTIENRTVTGLASIFGNVDSYGDIVHKGAFKKTIKENAGRVRHLWMHDMWQPPTAAIKELKEVGREELPEDVQKKFPEATGGLLVAREYLQTPRADEILAGITTGAINEMSFGYDTVKWEFVELEDDTGKKSYVRHLKELRLWDTSDVNFGANQATVASKAAPFLAAYKDGMAPDQFALLEELATTVENALSPEQLKAGRVLSASNLEKLKSALSVLSEILLAAEPPEDDDAKRALTEQILVKLQLYERDPILLVR